ncbi:nitroreductase family protein [Paraburkholderia unamae]|uniref:Nitroreductase n=1 Tax=Paraburkholderia unamae TaxID=219649 RepID=A0ABX5KBN5_9BURK|nr:nitroreductase family protein [Paraburkholderia unamae]PVX72865.1 nitroreductase [Paraburkholderia unamae]CAG9272637.1 Nitroreductase [Paraburkholderia unamae]
MTLSNQRTADHPIDRQFLDRWSPRAFTDDTLPEATLLTFLEAARWAPSSYNAQPWRFVYARRGTAHWSRFVGFLNEFNRGWAQHAAAIVIVVSKKTFVPPGTANPVALATHSFDSGAAWAQLALQASLAGWKAHGLAGIERERIREQLALPDDYAIEAALAIGRPGDPAQLSETLRAREVPSSRAPLAAIAAEGRFVFAE